ncbi:MAG TPA: hypothetical protein VJY86_01730 [Bacilli bacterium]|jgi:hypothetical protein|nr:hypothetical protein [Bacilli bacterium]
MSNKVYEVRCPYCGFVYTYSEDEIQTTPLKPDGFTVCPMCKQQVSHKLAKAK